MKKEKRNMNQVVEKKKTDVVLAGMFEQDADTGLDNMGSDDFALPFLRILAQLSPEVNERDAKYVEGAKAGMIFNTVTKQTYDGEEGVNIIPCHYKREYVEWSDRGQGTSAPVAIHSASSNILREATRGADYKDRLPSGNYLENTASYFVLTEDAQTALVSMKSTQLKVSRSWNSMMKSIKLKGKSGLFTPASYSHLYNLKAVQQSNDKGTWFGWAVTRVGPVQDKEVYAAAKNFAETCRKGDVNAKHGEDSTESKEQVPF
jgi:hypothetical protein|tara:strand:- start:2505 stop:3287 length:783 start_codon:yes stop_codon:yes gene_type:complete